MNPLVLFYRIFLYQPLLNLLIFLYNLKYVDFGIAIIILTIIVKVLTLRLDTHALLKQKESQIKGAEIQKEMKEIQEKYKDDPQRQAEELRALFKEKGFNPFSSFLPMVIQIIIIIALFQIFRHPITQNQLTLLYSFVKNPGTINYLFLRTIDLSKPNSVLAVLVALIQFFYSKTLFSYQRKFQKKAKLKKKKEEGAQEKFQKVMQNQMIYGFPIITFLVCLTLPSALPLFWGLSTLIGFLEVKFTYKKN